MAEDSDRFAITLDRPIRTSKELSPGVELVQWIDGAAFTSAGAPLIRVRRKTWRRAAVLILHKNSTLTELQASWAGWVVRVCVQHYFQRFLKRKRGGVCHRQLRRLFLGRS